MPNHCTNTLTIKGPAEILASFERKAKGEQEIFDVDNFLPMPQELRGNTSPSWNPEQDERMLRKHGAKDWHDWALLNWGTKRGAYEAETVRHDGLTLQYCFYTAWGPLGENLMEEISRKFPALRLELKYEEPGMAFKGKTVAESGILTESWSRNMTEEEARTWHDEDKE